MQGKGGISNERKRGITKMKELEDKTLFSEMAEIPPGPADLGREVAVKRPFDDEFVTLRGTLIGITYEREPTCNVRLRYFNTILKSLPVKCVRLWDEGQ